MDKIIHKIAFCGRMGAGKSTAAIALTGIYTDEYGYQDVKAWVVAFANPLKQCAMAFHQEGKPRVFLQRLGDLARREFGDDVLDKILEENVNHLLTQAVPQIPHRHILVMCDDLRFRTEYDTLKRMGFTVVRIEADEEIRKARLGSSFTQVKHRSEMELDLFEPDFVIHNNINEPFNETFVKDIRQEFQKRNLI